MAGLRLVTGSNWGDRFNSTSPTELLRTRPDYTALQDLAFRRKQQLIRSSEQNATYNAQLQPLRQQLEQQRIEHEAAATLAAGAAERYKHERDMQTMQDQVGFLNHMESAPAPGTAAYHQHLLNGINQFPGILSTDYGKTLLTEMAQKHDSIQSLTNQLPPGFQPTSIEVGAGKQNKITARRSGLDDSEAAAKELFAHHKLTPSELLSPDTKIEYGNVKGVDTSTTQAKFTGANDGKIAQITTGEGKPPVRMQVSEYNRYKNALTPNATQPEAVADPNKPSLDFYSADSRPFTEQERQEYMARSNARLVSHLQTTDYGKQLIAELGLDKPAATSLPAPTAVPAVQPTALPVSTAAPATIDRKALAQQALNDPDATDAHKAAAQKILAGQ